MTIIKVALDLFVMLRQTLEGCNLFILLLQLMNRYCCGVIVESVETLEEWRDMQRSSELHLGLFPFPTRTADIARKGDTE